MRRRCLSDHAPAQPITTRRGCLSPPTPVFQPTGCPVASPARPLISLSRFPRPSHGGRQGSRHSPPGLPLTAAGGGGQRRREADEQRHSHEGEGKAVDDEQPLDFALDSARGERGLFVQEGPKVVLEARMLVFEAG